MRSRSAAVLFDLDGVLVDSRAAISGCMAAALAAQGLAPPEHKSLERHIGAPLTRAFAELTGQAEDSQLVLDCVAGYRARYRAASLRQTTVFDGVPAVLGSLADSFTLAVATSKPRAFAEPLLAALDLRPSFAVLAAPDLDAHRENKAETIRSAMSTLATDRAVMVGDRAFDVDGAHACGIPAIGVLWGIGSRRELAEAGADAIVSAPHELPGAVHGVLGLRRTRESPRRDGGRERR